MYRSTFKPDGLISLYITNKGLGPAIIEKLNFRYKQNDYSIYSDYFALISNKIDTSIVKLTIDRFQIYENSVISSNEKIELFTIQVKPIIYFDSILNIIDNTTYPIVFKDIYDNEFKNEILQYK
jgi:hypothetical protein